MNRSAVLHIPMSQDAFGTDETSITIRLRTAGNDVKSCVLYYGDRACRQTPVIFTGVPMKVTAQTSLFDYYEVQLENPYKRLCYYFELESEGERVLYYGDEFHTETVDDRSEYYQLPFNHRADIVRPPEWAGDTIIYNIFPDSFATSKDYISKISVEKEFQGKKTRGKLGGTIRGIMENVGYLEELGVNAVYINPVFAAGEYHKYDLLDYFHVDSCFGTNEEFKSMVTLFHEHGIRVIIDGVFNHCGWQFFAFEDVVEKGKESKYADWFYYLEYPVVRPEDPEEYPDYECFGYERMMPKLNTQNPEVENYFCEVCRYWIEEFDIDGWRLDVASEVNDHFWRKFAETAKKAKKDAILIGEVWETASHWLDGTMFDSTMNYDFRKHCRRFFGDASIDAREFDDRITNMRMRYRSQTVYAQLNLLDSHDVSRFLSLCGGDREKYQLAILFQMTFPGMPSVFYGDEQGLEGILEEEYRQPMCFDRQEELFSFFKTAISLRKREKTLRQGSYRTLQAEKGNGLYVYERELDGEKIRIFLNMDEREQDISRLCGGTPISVEVTTNEKEQDISGKRKEREILWQKGKQGMWLMPKGFLVERISEKGGTYGGNN